MSEQRTIASLTRLEKNWLRNKHCGFCETSCLGDTCFAYSGSHVLPVIEGVRDQEEVVDLGPPCNMDEKRAGWLKSYKPRKTPGAKP